MNLQDWLQLGWIVAHKTDKQEIRNLLEVASRDIEDSQKDISADWQMNIAYNAVLALATAALAASGYRVTREAHHYRTLQSLEYTINLDRKTVDQLDAFRKKRNITGYDMAGTVSKHEAIQMISLAIQIRASVDEWLKEKHYNLFDG